MWWRTVVRTDKEKPDRESFDATMLDPFGGRHNLNGASLSGHERNNVSLGHGDRFVDVSGVSGFDDPADGRALALFDYDRDGWQDLAVANANTPFVQIFRNQIGELTGSKPDQRAMLALRFVGGNRTAKSAQGFAPREGYGAVAEVDVGGATLIREHRAGEGFAAQNSATLLVGLGDAKQAERLRVRWPSGRTQQLDAVPAFSLVTVYEDPSEAPDGSGFVLEPYRRPRIATRAPAERPLRTLDVGKTDGNVEGLRLVTTMATWCASCKGELPQLAHLRREFGNGELQLLAVPVDEDDTPEKLARYLVEYEPAYEMLRDLSAEQIGEVKQVILHDLRRDVLPASIVTDGRGRILRTQAKVPSVSEIRELLAKPAA